MRYSFLFCVFLCFSGAYAQTQDYLAAIGKLLVINGRSSYSSDFTEAIELLEKAVKQNPNNQEAHYYLGSAYDYSHNPDFTSTINSKKDLSIRASKEFEEVIKISAAYTGEIIALDPYAKLTSIWGCLAYSYNVRNKPDSAQWAYAEGKRRGGFPDFALHYYRYLLQKLEPNSIYISYGDFSTMIIGYLQTMEQLRNDVPLVHFHTIGIPWVSEHAYKKYPWLFSSAKAVSDTTPYFEWAEHTITVPIKNTGKKFEWRIAPTIDDKYITRANSLLIDLVTTNRFQKGIYFEKGSPPEETLGLYLYTKDCFVADKVNEVLPLKYQHDFFDHFETFPFHLLSSINPNCSSELSLANNLRINFMQGVMAIARDEKRLPEARKLFEKMEKQIPESKYPYIDESYRSNAQKLKELLNEN